MEMEVIWNLNEGLLFSDSNSPQLQGNYQITSDQAVNMVDVPLQNFNFIKTNPKEVKKLISKSSIEIKWKQTDGEEKKEVIYFNTNN